MAWWLTRTLAAWAGAALGALAGHALGAELGLTQAGLWLGVALGLLAVTLLELRRAQGLLRWLRGDLADEAPRSTGLWGELAYRCERVLRISQGQTVRESERLRQFLSAIDASPNGVLLLDAQGQIEWCNVLAAEHFGLDRHADLRQRITNLVRAPAFVAHLQAGRFEEPVLFDGPSGRTRLSVMVRPYGEAMRMLLSQDITEGERIETMRRDFVANVSHEIRTPLTVLAGYVESLATLPLSDAERQRALAAMAQQTGRMQALVADLLMLAQLEGSPRPAADRWLPLAPLFERALADATALSNGRHEIGATGAEEVELAVSEHEWLSAVGNLLNNAVRYTPAGGQIGLRWDWREDGGGRLSVQDNGVGVAREHLARLTERFYRVDGSRSRDTGGTGLGLSIVKHVAQRHGGEIQIQSEPGRGSIFSIVLPAARVRRRRALQLPKVARVAEGASADDGTRDA